MASTNQGCIEWNHIHPISEPQFLLSHSKQGAGFGGHEQFVRVVTRFAVNIDGPSKVRSLIVVHPVVIVEPRISVRKGDQVPAAGMVQTDLGGVQDMSNSVDALKQ